MIMGAAAKTILAVEMHADTGREISSQLRRAGHKVLTARTTDEAYSLLREHSEIDLLLADLLASGTFDATDLVERAKSLRSGLQVLLTTDLRRFARAPDENRGHETSQMVAMIGVLLHDE
jgi:DNA-binding NtrC family response regulator